MMKNWQLITLIGLIASQSSCTTAQTTKYESRDSMGYHQTTYTIQNEHRRQNDDLLTKSVERINWDKW